MLNAFQTSLLYNVSAKIIKMIKLGLCEQKNLITLFFSFLTYDSRLWDGSRTFNGIDNSQIVTFRSNSNLIGLSKFWENDFFSLIGSVSG